MSKYDKQIKSSHTGTSIEIDVYSVLEAFEVHCPARQHAIKKLLCAGQRGEKSVVQDLIEARVSANRAIDMESYKSEGEE